MIRKLTRKEFADQIFDEVLQFLESGDCGCQSFNCEHFKDLRERWTK